MTQTIHALGIPLQDGARPIGCAAGPDALRAAGVLEMLRGHMPVADHGNVRPGALSQPDYSPGRIAAWIDCIHDAALAMSDAQALPVFLGGDHALSAGTVPAMALRAKALGRPLYVLWLDAHPDFHTLDSTQSGNLHGTPAAYFTGQAGFAAYPPLAIAVPPANVHMIGVRSVDPGERALMTHAGLTLTGEDLRAFLTRVAQTNGLLHVSFDIDVLQPHLVPGVGTPVEGGLSAAELATIMDTVRDSGLLGSLDIVELNPALDIDGRTARCAADAVQHLARPARQRNRAA